MKTKADKHREAGTLDAFRARQTASRASTAAYRERVMQENQDEAEQLRRDAAWVRAKRLQDEEGH